MIKLFQWNLTRDERREMFHGNMKDSEEAGAYMDKGMSFMPYDAAKWFHRYKHVADVFTNDLDESFMVMNHRDMMSERFRPMTENFCSMSVGDILLTDQGDYFMVAGEGFDKIEITHQERNDYV